MHQFATRCGARESHQAGRARMRGTAGQAASGARREMLSPYHALGNHAVARLLALRVARAKLAVSQPGDRLERQADRVADAVSSGGAAHGGVAEHVSDGAAAPARGIQRTAVAGTGGADVAAASTALTRGLGSGRPLDDATRAWFEPRLGADLGGVRVHTGPTAAAAAGGVRARAFALGRDVVFGSGEYAPHSASGRRLLAHELAHVVQQAGGSAHLSAAGEPCVQRSPDEHATSFGTIRMEYNGDDLIVFGDDREIHRYSAHSGRPVTVPAAVAEECGADPLTASFLDDKRFVGIHDNGPIPEGTYQFNPGSIQRFDLGEELQLLGAGIRGHHDTTVQGQKIHAGDWGSGRVHLVPITTMREGPCGNVNKRGKSEARDAFFLHGGWLAGSSGCIDIGRSFDDLAEFLHGFPRSIKLTVRYTNEPPDIRFFRGLGGAIAYHGAVDLQHGPRVGLGGEFGTDPVTGAPVGRFLVRPGYDAIVAWAGGAVRAGVQLDIVATDRDAFVRAGLIGAADFRILGKLYGQLSVGASVPLSGTEPAGVSRVVGGGLSYDLGRVQLGLMYDYLHTASDREPAVHQALLSIGVRLGRE